MLVAWLVTFPAAGIIGAAACALTKTGIGGVIGVVLIAIVLAFVIFRLSRRNPVNSMNVNDQSDVKINAEAAAPAQAA